MLFFKRGCTGCLIFPFLFLVFFLGGSMLGGAIVGAQAGSHTTSYESGYQAGQKAGREFGRKYGMYIMLGSGAISGMLALAIAFSGVLPWCRAPREEIAR